MLRRALNVVLLGGAAALIAFNVGEREADPRRTAIVLALACVGVFLNFAGLLLPSLSLRPLLRATGRAVLLIIAAGFAVAAWRLGSEPIAPEARADAAVVETLRATVERFWWVAAAVAYVGMSLLVLPPRITSGR